MLVTSDLGFYVYSGALPRTEGMRLFYTGNLAIGSTTDNGNRLQVNGNVTATRFNWLNIDQNGGRNRLIETTAQGIDLQANTTTNLFRVLWADAGVPFTVNNNGIVVSGTITTNGNILVAKSSPTLTLRDQIDDFNTSIVFDGYTPRGSYAANGNFDHVITLNNQFNVNPSFIIRSITGTGAANLAVQGSASFGNSIETTGNVTTHGQTTLNAGLQVNGPGIIAGNIVSIKGGADGTAHLRLVRTGWQGWSVNQASAGIEFREDGASYDTLRLVSGSGVTVGGILRSTKPTDGLMVGFGANNSPDLLTFSYSNIVSGSSTIESSVWGPLVLSTQSNNNIVLDPNGTGKVHIGPRLAPAYAKLTVTGGDIMTVDGNVTVFKPTGPKLLLTTGENAGIDGAPKNIDIEFAGFYGANAIIRAQETSASNSRSPIIFYNHDIPGVMQERARIARGSGNFLIGTPNDGGAKLAVAGGYLRIESGVNSPPAVGKGLELAFDDVANLGYVLAHDRSIAGSLELRLGANGALRVSPIGQVQIHTSLFIPTSQSHICFAGDSNNYLGNVTYFRDGTGASSGTWINGTTGAASFGGIVSSNVEYRLGGNSYSRVAQMDGGGGWGGGYNFNMNSSTPQRDSTGAVSAIRFETLGNVDIYAENSGSPGAIGSRYRFSPTGAIFGSPLTSTFQSLTADPTTLDLSAGQSRLIKNTTSGSLRLWANDGGTIKSVPLT